MARKTIGELEFATVYPLYLRKVTGKGRTQDELDTVITWLTGYDRAAIRALETSDTDFRTFFDQAPALNPLRDRITGLICGHRVEAIEDPVAQKARQLDKLVDELAKGRAMEKVLRS